MSLPVSAATYWYCSDCTIYAGNNEQTAYLNNKVLHQMHTSYSAPIGIYERLSSGTIVYQYNCSGPGYCDINHTSAYTRGICWNRSGSGLIVADCLWGTS